MSADYDPVKHLGDPINHQKMYDFERDIIRVKNPLSQDFTFYYDGMPVTVPANGTKDMERYLVRRYVWEIMGHIYNQMAASKMQVAEEAFKRNHPDVMDDPYLINTQIYDKLPRVDNPQFQQKVIADCVAGVVSKFGANRIIPNAPKNGQLDPNTPLFQQLINDFRTPGVDEQAPAQETNTAPVTAEEATLG